MTKAIARTVVSLIALVTFLFVGADIVGASQAWECTCIHRECEWCTNDEDEWDAFHAEAKDEYADAFTALFNSYETKWSKNNRLMIRKGNDGPFRFAKRS